MATVDDYKIIPAPDTNELLRYHLTVTERVDRQLEIKQHEKALANLHNPPVHVVHQHAPISHAAQKTPVNPNNAAAEAAAKKAKQQIAEDDKQSMFKPLTEEQQEAQRIEMQKQVAAASQRKAADSVDSPASVGNGAGSTATPAPAPAAAPVSAIPEWPPKL